MPQSFIYGAATTPDQTDGGQVYTLGQPWSADAAGQVTGNEWLAPTNAPVNQCRMCLFRVSDMLKVAESNLFTATLGVINSVAFTSPFLSAAGVEYISGVVTDRYAFKNPGGYPYTTANLTTTGTGTFVFSAAGTPTFPDGVSASNYMVGPIWNFAEASLSWTPVQLTLSGVTFTLTPGMITLGWTPVAAALAGVPFAALTPGMVTAPWTPAEIRLAAQPYGFDAGPGILTASGTSLSTLTASGRGRA